MQDDSQGGDGAANIVTGEEHNNLPPIQGEVSSTPEELEAKINEELGIPNTPAPKTEEPVEPKPPAEETPKEPVEPDTEEAEEATEEPETPVEPATPSDEELFIEVEDAEGVTYKISKIEDLPEDFVAKNNRQGYEILRALDKLDDQIAKRDADRVTAEAEAEKSQAQKEQFDSWDKEIDNLGKEKRLDAKDQETIDKVFEHMVEINKARAKAGNPNMITSFEDALDKYEAKVAKDVANDKTKQENDRAKLKASLIGGTNSPASGEAAPYRSGQYRSMDEIPIG